MTQTLNNTLCESIHFVRACPVCDNHSGYHLDKLNFKVFDDLNFPTNLMLAFCPKCGHIFYDGDLTNDQITEYYGTKEYNPTNVGPGSGSQTKEDIEHQQQIIARLADWYDRTKDGVTFDVGAGRGGLAKSLINAGYGNVIAIEPSVNTVRLMISQNLNASLGSAENLPKLGKSPTLAIYSHIMEHLLEPKRALKEIRNVMSPDGIVYVEVPDAGSYLEQESPYQYFYLEHLSHFTVYSLRYLLEQCGFDVLHLERAKFAHFNKERLSQQVLYSIATPKPNERPISPVDSDLGTHVLPIADENGIRKELDGFLNYLNWSSNHPSIKKLETLAKSGKTVWIWGISQLTMLFLGRKPLSDANIVGFIDKDPSKQRHRLIGKPILPPETLKKLGKDDTVLLMPYGYVDSMLSYLKEIGFQGQAVPLRTD
jgi:SAM-dependent methyltransferase